MIDPDLIYERGIHILQDDTCECDILESLEYKLLDHECTLPDACDCSEIEDQIQEMKTRLEQESQII